MLRLTFPPECLLSQHNPIYIPLWAFVFASSLDTYTSDWKVQRGAGLALRTLKLAHVQRRIDGHTWTILGAFESRIRKAIDMSSISYQRIP